VRESRDAFAPAEFGEFAGGAAVRELAEEPAGALGGEFARVPGGVFLAIRVVELDEAVSADGVTGCVDAGFAVVADLGADAASVWAEVVS
jgi:hypothetical protein